MKLKTVRRFRSAFPNKDGWWLWKESRSSDTPERLLICADRKHAEVATDQCLELFYLRSRGVGKRDAWIETRKEIANVFVRNWPDESRLATK